MHISRGAYSSVAQIGHMMARIDSTSDVLHQGQDAKVGRKAQLSVTSNAYVADACERSPF